MDVKEIVDFLHQYDGKLWLHETQGAQEAAGDGQMREAKRGGVLDVNMRDVNIMDSVVSLVRGDDLEQAVSLLHRAILLEPDYANKLALRDAAYSISAYARIEEKGGSQVLFEQYTAMHQHIYASLFATMENRK